MSWYVLVPLQYATDWDLIDISPIGAYGAEVEGFEIFNTLNSPRTDYAPIYGFEQQPITITNASHSFTMPSFLDGSVSAVYMRWEAGVTIPIGVGVENNYITLYTGADTGTLVERLVGTVYGDGSAKAGISLDDSGGTVTPYCDTIGLYDDNYNDKTFRVTLAHDEPDIATYGDEWKLYEFMVGYMVALPDGHVREENQAERATYGGKLTYRPFGQPLWSGLNGQKKESTELVFEGLRQTQRDNLVSMFAYSRGVFPLLLIERFADKDTWRKMIMTGLEETEDGGYFNLTIGFVEE